MSTNYDQLKMSNMASPTMVSDRFVQVVQADNRHVYKHAGYYAVDDKKVISSINPVTSVPSSLSNATVDFRIDNGIVDVLQYISLHMYLTNNTGGNATLVGAPLWILRLEVFGNEGSTLLSTITGDDLYQQYLFLSRNNYESQSTACGLSASTYNSTGATIADTASVEFVCPIYHWFKSVGISPAFLRSGLLLRFVFNSTAMTHITGTAMTCTSLSCTIRGKKLKEEAKNALREIYSPHSRIPLSLSHLMIDRMQVTQALVANQVFQISLTGLRGVCSFLLFTIRTSANTASATGQLSYLRADTWDILDSSNGSLVGNLRRTNALQQVDWSNNFQNEAWNQKQFHMMSWSADPQGDYAHGTNSGYALLTGSEKISITVPSTFASTTYFIEIKAFIHANLVLDKGQLRVERD